MTNWWLSVVGPYHDSHFGEMGTVLIHNEGFPDGVHLATLQWVIARRIVGWQKVVDVARELYEESLERNGPMEGNRFAEAFADLDPQKTQKGGQEL